MKQQVKFAKSSFVNVLNMLIENCVQGGLERDDVLNQLSPANCVGNSMVLAIDIDSESYEIDFKGQEITLTFEVIYNVLPRERFESKGIKVESIDFLP